MTITPIKSFVIRMPDGSLKSYAVGIPYEVSEEEAEYFVAIGLADETPSGGKTSTVTILNSTGESLQMYVPCYNEGVCSYVISVADPETEIAVVLGDNGTDFAIKKIDTYQVSEVSGDITQSSPYECSITGDGSITIIKGSPK